MHKRLSRDRFRWWPHGIDNDCDGLTDAEDPNFLGSQPEICDGLDNDGDGRIDGEDPDVVDADWSSRSVEGRLMP